MRYWRFLTSLLAALLGGLLQAAAPHPSLLQVNDNGDLIPVVGFNGKKPIVIKNNKEVLFAQKPKFRVGRASQFAAGSVEISHMDGVDLYYTGFKLALTSDRDIRGAYAAIVIYDNGFIVRPEANYPATYVYAHALPDLPANKTVKVTLTSPHSLAIMMSDKTTFDDSPLKLVRGGGYRAFFPLIFTAGGYEIRNNLWPMAAEYFHKIDIVKQRGAAILYQRHYEQADHAPVPFITIPPLLPAGESWPGKPIMVTFELTAEGTVKQVELAPNPSSPVGPAITEALGDWLFMPKLEHGVAVPARVKMPLKF